ncbi:MAG: enoyl-CoA hydratase/isomerase family protein [Burkholderiaceae bacterium]
MPEKKWGAGVEVEVHDNVVVVAYNRPERRNAMSPESGQAVAEVLDHYLSEENVRVIVMTGRGGHFCAGGDIHSMHSSEGMSAEAGRKRMRKSLHRAERLYTSDKLVVAAVEGVAFGGGFASVLLADLVIASASARFCMSFPRVGLVPDTCSLYTLPRIVGVQRAKELMLTGREIDAKTALEYGIAMEVVPEGAALARALVLARALATTSATASAMAKTGLNMSLSSDFRSMVEYECAAQGIAFSSDYHREAVDRFRSKREPQFVWPR